MGHSMVGSRFSIQTLLIFAAILQIVWGLVPSASKFVISEIPVELYITLRWTISGLILLIAVFLQSRPSLKLQKEAVYVALLGIGGYALASFGTLYGLKIGGVTNFALMGSLSPIITSAVAIFFLKERPARLFFVALPFCASGLVLLIVGKHQISSWNVALLSSALILGATFFEAVIFVFSKKMKSYFSSIQYLAISQIAAAGFMWTLQATFLDQSHLIQNLSTRGWMAAVFVSVVACVLCYAVLYWLLNYIDGHRLALFDGLHTLSAVIFGYILFNESLNFMMIAGGTFLLTGLVLGNLPRNGPKVSRAQTPQTPKLAVSE